MWRSIGSQQALAWDTLAPEVCPNIISGNISREMVRNEYCLFNLPALVANASIHSSFYLNVFINDPRVTLMVWSVDLSTWGATKFTNHHWLGKNSQGLRIVHFSILPDLNGIIGRLWHHDGQPSTRCGRGAGDFEDVEDREKLWSKLRFWRLEIGEICWNMLKHVQTNDANEVFGLQDFKASNHNASHDMSWLQPPSLWWAVSKDETGPSSSSPWWTLSRRAEVVDIWDHLSPARHSSHEDAGNRPHLHPAGKSGNRIDN